MSRRLPVVAAALAALVAAVPASAGAPAATTGPATSIGARSAIVSGTVDPGGKGTTWSIEYGTTSAYGSRSDARSAGNGTSAVDVTHQLTGLSTGVTYYYRVVASNDDGTSRGAGMTFTTRGAPEVRTGAAALIGPGAANLGGTVDPNGRSTGWWVEYGTTSRYGNRTETRSAGAGVSPVGVAVRVGGLTAGVTYHFRLVAANDIGTTAGGDVSFRTDSAPTVSTAGADSITPTSARVSGRVDPRGRGTVAWFEYGTTTRLGNRTGDINAGFARGASTQRSTIGGLQPATAYHYRIVARSDAGTTYGQIRSFRTSAGPLATTGAATALRALGHPHRNRRPGRSRDDRLVRARADDRVRHANGRQAGGLGPRRVAVSETVAGLTPGTEYHVRLVAQSSGGTTLRRRRRLPDSGPPDRRADERLRDLSRAGADPRGRRLRRARDPGLGRVRPRRRADGAHGRRPASRLERDDVRLVPAHRAGARPPLRLPHRRRERSRHGDRGDGDVRHRRPSSATTVDGSSGARSSGRTGRTGSSEPGGAT